MPAESRSAAHSTLLRSHDWLLPLIVYLTSLVGVIIAYRDTTITFLRAESGWYQLIAHSDDATQRNMKQMFWTKSYHGHYTPLAFWLEFEQTKLAGPRAGYWRCRAFLVAALAATAIFFFARTVASQSGLNIVAQNCLGAGAAATVIFQPLMREMIAWPFLSLQLMWIILAMFASRALVGIISSLKRRRRIWISAITAYASLHVSGLGIASAVATLGILLLLLFLTYRRETKFFEILRQNRGSLIAASGVLAFLTLIHAGCMWLLVSQKTVSTSELMISLHQALLGFFGLYPFFLAHTLFLYPSSPFNIAAFLQDAWPFGIAFAFLLLAGVVVFARQATYNRNFAATRLVLFGFSVLFYLVFVGSIAMRESSSASSANPLMGYFIGARYVVPASIIWMVAVLALVMPTVRHHQRLTSVTLVGLAVCALIGQRQFAGRTYRQVQPHAVISHDRAWSLVVAMAYQSRAAGLPVPNVPLGHLTREFYDWDTKLFEPLLRSELHLPSQERIAFIDMQKGLSARRVEYQAKVPAFTQLREVLKLNELSPP